MGSISTKDFVPNGLILPSSVEPVKVQRGVLSEVKFEAPKELILDGYCTPVENQGDKPWCAAYAATSYAENVMWRKRHYHKDLDPKAICCHKVDSGVLLQLGRCRSLILI